MGENTDKILPTAIFTKLKSCDFSKKRPRSNGGDLVVDILWISFFMVKSLCLSRVL